MGGWHVFANTSVCVNTPCWSRVTRPKRPLARPVTTSQMPCYQQQHPLATTAISTLAASLEPSLTGCAKCHGGARKWGWAVATELNLMMMEWVLILRPGQRAMAMAGATVAPGCLPVLTTCFTWRMCGEVGVGAQLVVYARWSSGWRWLLVRPNSEVSSRRARHGHQTSPRDPNSIRRRPRQAAGKKKKTSSCGCGGGNAANHRRRHFIGVYLGTWCL